MKSMKGIGALGPTCHPGFGAYGLVHNLKNVILNPFLFDHWNHNKILRLMGLYKFSYWVLFLPLMGCEFYLFIHTSI